MLGVVDERMGSGMQCIGYRYNGAVQCWKGLALPDASVPVARVSWAGQ